MRTNTGTGTGRLYFEAPGEPIRPWPNRKNGTGPWNRTCIRWNGSSSLRRNLSQRLANLAGRDALSVPRLPSGFGH